MKKAGVYIIKDKFFADAADPYLRGNKEGMRPHYYCFKDDGDGIYWMIPLSSRIEKYQAIIDKRTADNKPCDMLHIAELDNRHKSVFLIQDMFPITDEYIEREYTVNGNHLMLTKEHTAREIEKKAWRVAGLLKRGIKVYAHPAGCKRDIKNAERKQATVIPAGLAVIKHADSNRAAARTLCRVPVPVKMPKIRLKNL